MTPEQEERLGRRMLQRALEEGHAPRAFAVIGPQTDERVQARRRRVYQMMEIEGRTAADVANALGVPRRKIYDDRSNMRIANSRGRQG